MDKSLPPYYTIREAKTALPTACLGRLGKHVILQHRGGGGGWHQRINNS
jgi:hypothetical protein